VMAHGVAYRDPLGIQHALLGHHGHFGFHPARLNPPAAGFKG
jgi:hypothetical protein